MQQTLINLVLKYNKDFFDCGRELLKSQISFKSNRQLFFHGYRNFKIVTRENPLSVVPESLDHIINCYKNITDNTSKIALKDLVILDKIPYINRYHYVITLNNKKYFEALPWANALIILLANFHIISKIFHEHKIKFNITKDHNLFVYLKTFIKINYTPRLDHVSSGIQNIGLLMGKKELLEQTRVIKSNDNPNPTLINTILHRIISLRNVTKDYDKSDNFHVLDLAAIKDKLKQKNAKIEPIIGVDKKLLKKEESIIDKNFIKEYKELIKKQEAKEFKMARISIKKITKDSDYKYRVAVHGLSRILNPEEMHFIMDEIFTKTTVKDVVMKEGYNASSAANKERLLSRIKILLKYNFISPETPEKWELLHLCLKTISHYLIDKIGKLLAEISGGIKEFKTIMNGFTEETSPDGIEIDLPQVTYIFKPEIRKTITIKHSAYDSTKKMLIRYRRTKFGIYSDKLDKAQLKSALPANLIQTLDSTIVHYVRRILMFITFYTGEIITIHDAYFTSLDPERLRDVVRIAIFITFKPNIFINIAKTNNMPKQLEYLERNYYNNLFTAIENPLEDCINSTFIHILFQHKHKWRKFTSKKDIGYTRDTKVNVKFFNDIFTKFANKKERSSVNKLMQNIIITMKLDRFSAKGLGVEGFIGPKSLEVMLAENKIKSKAIYTYIKKILETIDYHVLGKDKPQALIYKLRKLLNDEIVTY